MLTDTRYESLYLRGSNKIIDFEFQIRTYPVFDWAGGASPAAAFIYMGSKLEEKNAEKNW